MENYLRKIRNEEQSKNINKIKVSSWYPSNLISPVRVNGRIFNPKEEIKKQDINSDEDHKDNKIDENDKIINQKEKENLNNDEIKEISDSNKNKIKLNETIAEK